MSEAQTVDRPDNVKAERTTCLRCGGKWPKRGPNKCDRCAGSGRDPFYGRDAAGELVLIGPEPCVAVECLHPMLCAGRGCRERLLREQGSSS